MSQNQLLIDLDSDENSAVQHFINLNLTNKFVLRVLEQLIKLDSCEACEPSTELHHFDVEKSWETDQPPRSQWGCLILLPSRVSFKLKSSN